MVRAGRDSVFIDEFLSRQMIAIGCLRACILLSWVGLEDGLDYAVEGWGARGRTIKTLPTKLKVRMLAFLLPLSEPLVP
jgi:hypothetical protein